MPKFRGIYYTVAGAGKPLLLLHGWGANLDCFAGIATDLEQNFTVYRLDFWGFGASDEPPKFAGIETYAEAVADFIYDIIGAKTDIIGHSFGGRVAILLGANCNFVDKIVLVDSAGLKPRKNIAKRIREYRYKAVKKKVAQGKCSAEVLDTFGSADYKALNETMRNVFVRVVNTDLAKIASEITNPVLLVWGKHDHETPLYMAKKLRKIIKNSTLQVLEGGHFCFIDASNEFLRVCYDFLLD